MKKYWICALIVCLIATCVASAEPFWLETEYLLWFIKDSPVPTPLLTTASFADELPGAIGQPGTHVRLGERDYSMGWMNGLQVNGVAQVCQRVKIEGSYFLLPTVTKKRSFHTSGEPGAPNFAVPIFDITGVCGLNGNPGETIFILPGPLEGDPGFFGEFNFHLASRLQGSELNGLYDLLEAKQFCLLAGFRWIQLHESLIFKAKTGTVPNVSFPPGFFNFRDRFRTANNFLGPQFGICGEYGQKRWKVRGELKGALGATLEEIKIEGSSQTSGGNLFFETKGTAREILPGGIFAEPSNIGKHTRSRFACLLEAHANARYKITRNLEIDLGYTFLWLSQVVRPGKQIDRKVNSTRTALADASRRTVGVGPGPIPFGTPGPAPAARGSKRPHVPFKSSNFWAQGIDVGITLKF